MATLVTPISYKNISATDVPPFGCVDFVNDCDIAGSTSVISIKATTPGHGSGLYALDSGKGAGTSTAEAYSQAFLPSNAPVWAYYLGVAAPGAAWHAEVGPYTGGFDLVTTGTGFIYAGVFDATNERILVISKKAFTDSNTGGGTGGGGCNCCDCTQCLNICAQKPNQVIETCSECGVAPRRYTIDLGTTIGDHTFTYVAGCVWQSENFDVNYTYPTGVSGSDTGTYKGTLTQNGISSTLEISYVSGVDVLKLSAGYRVLSWIADPDKEWSCVCNSAMIPSVPPDRFPPNLHVVCEPCVLPVADTDGAGDWTVCHVDAGCVSSLTLQDFTSVNRSDPNSIADNWTANIAKSDPESCCFTSITNGSDSCAAGVTCWNEIIDNFPDPSFWWGGSACVEADGFGSWNLVVSLEVGSGASVPTEVPVGNAVYSISVASLVSGTNTLSISSSAGSLTWSGTLDITVGDCTFEALNPDYGYGCGYDSTGTGGGGGDPPGCSGSCVFEWSEAGSSWSVVSAMSNCVGSGCSCHEPGFGGGYDGQLTSGSCST